MTTEIVDEVYRTNAEIRTTGVFNLTRALTPDEYDFIQTHIKSKLKRAFLTRNNSYLVESAIRGKENAKDLLSYISYVGQTFIKLDTKGFATPERAMSAINGLEELFDLPVFKRESKPVKIAFGSATFRISDTEFYRVYTDEDGLKVQSGELVPIWNQPVSVASREINEDKLSQAV